ncbi:MAG: riboflavin synthase [Victivallales bacterium]|nr:riboflavin synthase [Victivallales bacterium]
MFTGLIESVGKLKRLAISGKAGELEIAAAFSDGGLAIGDSVAVNGVCLTVTRFTANTISFHALAETLSRTNLGALKKGREVNLERALRLGDRLGGHIVSGHVDGTAAVQSIGRQGDDLELHIALSEELAPFLVMKGSIAINGVSLTVATLERGSFGVCIIPHTWTHTNLHELKPGDKVNLETDILGKYVLRQHELENETKNSSGVSMDMLANAGFM